MKKWFIKISALLEVWAESIDSWWAAHVRGISRAGVVQLVKERDMLMDQLDELEDSASRDYEKMSTEIDYLKDELADAWAKNKRLEGIVKDREDNNFQNIYPGLMAEITSLKETNELLQKAYVRLQVACMDNGVGEEEWYVDAVQPEEPDD